MSNNLTYEELLFELTRMQHVLNDILVELKKGEFYGQARV